jgi:hypothetical protein
MKKITIKKFKPTFYKPLKLISLIVISISLISCGGSGSSNGPEKVAENILPTLNIANSNIIVNEGETITLEASASDNDGNIIDIKWEQTEGITVNIKDSDKLSASIIAPATLDSEILKFNITVKDNDGGSRSANVTVTVNHINIAPSVEIGTDITVNELETVELNGVASDTDGTIKSYQWEQLSGTSVTINNSDQGVASFNAPETTETQVLIFQLSVTDDDDLSNADEISVTVKDVPPISTPPLYPNLKTLSANNTHTCSIFNSKAYCWGYNFNEQTNVPDDLVNPIKISAGGKHSCAIDDNGVHCWGDNSSGQIDVPSNLNEPTEIAAGGQFTCAIDTSGVHCWGANVDSDSVPSGLSNPKQISASQAHVCLIDDNGIQCWGSAHYGATTPPSTIVNPTQVITSEKFSCAVDDNGAQCWGSWMPSLPSGLVNIKQMTPDCILDDNGIQCWNADLSSNIPSFNNPTIIASGSMPLSDSHACVIDDDGMKCWGDNGSKQTDLPDFEALNLKDFSSIIETESSYLPHAFDADFIMKITNNTSKAFTLVSYKLFNRYTLMKEVTDSTELNNYQFNPGESVSITVNLTSDDLSSYDILQGFTGRFDLQEENGELGFVHAVIVE